MAACKSADTDKFMLGMRRTETPEVLFALQTQSRHTFCLKEASAIRPSGRTFRSASSRRSVLLEKATGLLLRLDFAFRRVAQFIFTLGFVAPREATLRWRFCGRSTGRMYSLSRLPVADSGSSPRPVPLLVRFCNTRVVLMLL